MIFLDFQDYLYRGNPSCLHTSFYEITDYYHTKHCGPCYFRAQFISEIPSQVTMRALSDAGTPEWNPQFNGHLLVVLGLVAPQPGESLKHFQKRRKKFSQPVGLFPVTSSLWRLMGYQPPLAIPLIEFCQGFSELEIAQKHDWSLWNVQNRLAKGSRTALNDVKRAQKRQEDRYISATVA